jgi:hypothetical protein
MADIRDMEQDENEETAKALKIVLVDENGDPITSGNPLECEVV